MPRLQVLQLPDQDDGQRTITPYALVIDDVTDAEAARLRNHTAAAEVAGARAVLILPNMTVEIPANDTTPFRIAGPVMQSTILTSHEAEHEVQLARRSLLADYGDEAGPLVDVLIRSVRRCYTSTDTEPAGA